MEDYISDIEAITKYFQIDKFHLFNFKPPSTGIEVEIEVEIEIEIWKISIPICIGIGFKALLRA